MVEQGLMVAEGLQSFKGANKRDTPPIRRPMSGGTSLSTIWNVWWTQKCWKNRPHPASLSSMWMIKIPIEIAAILPLFTTKSFYSWSIFTMWRVFQVISDTVCNRWLMNKTKLKIAVSCCKLLHVAACCCRYFGNLGQKCCKLKNTLLGNWVF